MNVHQPKLGDVYVHSLAVRGFVPVEKSRLSSSPSQSMDSCRLINAYIPIILHAISYGQTWFYGFKELNYLRHDGGVS